MVLEEREHALRRGATIYAELLGYALTGDAYHAAAPDPTGDGAYRAMKLALARAEVPLDALDYVNAHATSTPVGDPIELAALTRLLGSEARAVSVSSTKSAMGHLLGAAGAVEAIFSVLSLVHQVVPPTLNLHEPDIETEFDLVPLRARERRVRRVMSSSFGFGGTNAALVFGA